MALSPPKTGDMNNFKFNTSDLGSADSGILIYAGLLVLAMVIVARSLEGVTRSFRFHKAAGQIVAFLFLQLVPYLFITFLSLGSMEKPPEKTTVQLIMFTLSGVQIAQLVLLASATGNMLRSCTER